MTIKIINYSNNVYSTYVYSNNNVYFNVLTLITRHTSFIIQDSSFFTQTIRPELAKHLVRAPNGAH